MKSLAIRQFTFGIATTILMIPSVGIAQSTVTPAVSSRPLYEERPLYELASPLLKPDRTRARSIAAEAFQKLEVASKESAGNAKRLFYLVRSLVELQAMLGDRDGYTRSLALGIDLLSRDQELLAGIADNYEVARMLRLMIRLGDQRMTQILANAQVRLIRSKPEWVELHTDLLAFLEMITKTDREILDGVNLRAPARLLCLAVGKLSRLGRHAAASQLLDAIGPARVREGECADNVLPTVMSQGDVARFRTYQGIKIELQRKYGIDPGETTDIDWAELANTYATYGRFAEAQQASQQIINGERAAVAHAHRAGAWLQAGRPKDAMNAYLKSDARALINQWASLGRYMLPCALETIGDIAGAQAVFRHASRTSAKPWPGCAERSVDTIPAAAYLHHALKGDYDAAISEMRVVIQARQQFAGKFGPDPGINYWLADGLVEIAFVAAGDAGFYKLADAR